jgi:hypothetical protein
VRADDFRHLEKWPVHFVYAGPGCRESSHPFDPVSD